MNRRLLHPPTLVARGTRAASASAQAICLLALLVLPAQAELRVVVVAETQILASGSPATSGRYLDFESRDGYRVRLDLKPGAGDVLNPNFDGSLRPVRSTQIEEALREMRPVEGLDLEAIVYTLPGLPQGIGTSFCVGREVFLSPTFAPAPTAQIAATVVHELGHAVQHRYLSSPSERGWRVYRSLRGLDAARFHASAAHRDRPQEIFAEDFRMLYGGALANYSGSHENPTLPPPSAVAGLREFFELLLVGEYSEARPLARASNYPNPFNPSTTILVELRLEQLAVAREVRVEIFDQRGRRVRVLPRRPVAAEVAVPWDGKDDRGRTVSSGRYSYRVTVGHEAIAGSMLLIQ